MQNQTYLRKAEKNKCKFDLRFPEIKDSPIGKGITDQFSGMIEMWKYKQNNNPSKNQADQHLPMLKTDFQNNYDTIKYTWIGHSTAVLSFGKDANFLIDPVFSDRCAPTQIVGPKRFRDPACSIQELPKIDAVLVSHDHYDHLDENSLKKIYKLNNQAIFVAGLQSKDVFPKNCKMIQLDWTQKKQININGKLFYITFVPVCHWSRRGAFDERKRLWGGFIIETSQNQKIFYSGDTAYCSVFKEIGMKYGQFDLALLPIGAYQPRSFLRFQHVNPEEAVKIHQQIKSHKSVGVHWGTFPLGKQEFMRPKKDLQAAKKQLGISQDQFITVQHGASFTIKYKNSKKQDE